MVPRLAWPCGGSPSRGATRASWTTRRGPQPIHGGSWEWPNENVWWLSSQPVLTWPRSAAVRRTCIVYLRGSRGAETKPPRRCGRGGGSAMERLLGCVGLGHHRLGGDAQLHLVTDVGQAHAEVEIAALDRGGGVETDRIRREIGRANV